MEVVHRENDEPQEGAAEWVAVATDREAVGCGMLSVQFSASAGWPYPSGTPS